MREGTMSIPRIRLLVAVLLALEISLFITGTVSAHVPSKVGPYTVEVGWKYEPAYVGQRNAVLIIVTDADDEPVTDLPANALQVVVTTGGRQSGELSFEAGFDPEEMEGPLGEYDAPILPTAPGGYDFHVTGAIHDQTVDLTVTADDTQEPVRGTADIEFPTKLPTVTEIVTRLDRIDDRLAQASVEAAAANASDAKASADRALLIGSGIGTAGLVVAAIALVAAIRTTRRSGM
jgi:hypothetical protein